MITTNQNTQAQNETPLELNERNTSPFMTEKETAEYLRCSVPFLQQDRYNKKIGLPYIKFGKKILYKKTELEIFIKKFEVTTPTA